MNVLWLWGYITKTHKLTMISFIIQGLNLFLLCLILQLSINAFDYNCHVDLIKLLKQEGELLRLRKARQKMSELFPLTEGRCMLSHGVLIVSRSNHYLQLKLNFLKTCRDLAGVAQG